MNKDSIIEILLKLGLSGFISLICFIIFYFVVPLECALIMSSLLFGILMGLIEIMNSDFYIPRGNNGTH